MARSCKCHITGETGTTDTFVKIGKYYYKNQEIYDAEQKQKETYKSLIDYICYEFLGYGDGQPFPTSLPKKLRNFHSTIMKPFWKLFRNITMIFVTGWNINSLKQSMESYLTSLQW